MKNKILKISNIIIVLLVIGMGILVQYTKYTKYVNFPSDKSYTIKVDNKIYSNKSLKNNPNTRTLERFDDILIYDARFMDVLTGSSFRIPKHYDVRPIRQEKDNSLYEIHDMSENDKNNISMEVVTGTKEYFTKLIYPESETILTFEEIAELVPAVAYRVNNVPYLFKSHGAVVNTSEPDRRTAFIEDVNGNCILISVYDQYVNILDLVANFESLDAKDGHPYINAKYRDGIYIDNIVKVEERK